MTLADFILARIAEDEAVALAAEAKHGGAWCAKASDVGTHVEWAMVSGTKDWGSNSGVDLWDDDGHWGFGMSAAAAEHIAHNDPASVLAECEAKRRIVERCTEWASADTSGWESDFEQGFAHAAGDVLKLLALPYAAHEDYDEAWR